MSLSTGTRLGPYEIVSSIGAGGMGEVYKARDTRLDRFVAIKVLPDSLADDPERRERFEREARTISSLNHPHICALYDVGHEGATEFLVMELLEGETLADRLARGPLLLDQALRHAIDIADALGKAHRQGVIHRDLKPGNIMLTKQGAKLLDFGLARVGVTGAPTSGSFMPTEQRPLTQQGTVLGTFQYMSPEQLEGNEADARADIFAFGAVLYEMVTGRRAFDGKTQASLVASIMSGTPAPISSVQPMTPPALERAVRVCLAKDPEERWQTAQDLAHELKWILEGGSQVGTPAPVVARRKSRERWAWMTAAALGLVAIAASARVFMTPPPPAPDPTRFSVIAPKDITIEWPRVSPDGKTLAFVGRDQQGTRSIWVRRMDAFEATRLEGTDGVTRPFWSPDSKYLAYFAGTQLRKISVLGGPAQLICEAAFGSDGAWSPQGVILFDGRVSDPIRRVPDSGGVPTVAVKADASLNEKGSAWPYFLPDGRHFLFMSTNDSAPLALKVGSLDEEQTTVLADLKSRVEFASGHLFYVSEATLMARPFDVSARAFAGDPFPVTDRVQMIGNTGLVDFSTSNGGDLAYIANAQLPVSRLIWVDRTGKETPTLAPEAPYRDLSLSPDGTRLAVSVAGKGSVQIWIVDMKKGTSSPITFGDQNRIYPVWSRDGQRVFYHWDRASGDHGVAQKLASGAGDEQMLKTDALEMSPTDVSPDNKTVLVQAIGSGALDIMTLPVDGQAPFSPLLAAPVPISETRPQLSPDGRWLAYESDESGRLEVFVQSYPPSGGKWRISTDGGARPVWRGDGREIVFQKLDDSFWAVQVHVNGSNIEADLPVKVFQRRMAHNTRERNTWVMTRDGQRFLMAVPPVDNPPSSIQVVLNWAGGLARK